jgi:hypothetical protein
MPKSQQSWVRSQHPRRSGIRGTADEALVNMYVEILKIPLFKQKFRQAGGGGEGEGHRAARGGGQNQGARGNQAHQNQGGTLQGKQKKINK